MQLISQGLLASRARKHLEEELSTAPLFSALAQQVLEDQYRQESNGSQSDTDSDDTGVSSNHSIVHNVFPQYGLLGLRTQEEDLRSQIDQQNLIYANVTSARRMRPSMRRLTV